MRQETFKQQAVRVNGLLNATSLTDEDKRLAREAAFPSQLITRSYYRKRVAYCSECGCQVTTSLTKCPHCGAEFKAEPTEQHNWEAAYQCIMEAVDDVQVLRFVLIKRWTQYGKQTYYMVQECMRHIYNEQGDRYIFHRNVRGLSMYYDAWCFGTPIALKHEDKGTGYYSKALQRQNIDVTAWRIKSLIKQWQYKPIEDIMQQSDTFKMRVLATPWGEMLIKCGYMDLFNHCVRHCHTLSKEEQTAVRICHRNHYEMKDPSLWLDYIQLLRYFNLDVHNAHYVCPDDLRAEHQVLLERKQREEERRRAERIAKEYAERLEKMEKEKEAYQKRWGGVLMLALTGKDLSVRPLQTIDEFAAEGAAMHHCVFANGYYKGPNMILSAKDSEGNRLATIEYDIRNGKIVQCRAACNQVPERDKEIRRLIARHRKDFSQMLMAA